MNLILTSWFSIYFKWTLVENYIELKNILEDCEIIYSGHSKDKDKIFRSKKGKFIGQPDFILKNIKTNELIVIEEKYHHIPKQFSSFGNSEYYNNVAKNIEIKRNKKLFYEKFKD